MTVDRDDVCAVLVTRGDHPDGMERIMRSLPAHWGCVVWNNSVETDLAVYGRYAGVERAVAASRDDPADVRPADLIYVQDDDVELPPDSIAALIAAHLPGHVTCNMPAAWRDQPFYEEHALVGFGAVFDRELPAKAFDRYYRRQHVDFDRERGPISVVGAEFARCCDVVFTVLTPRIVIDVPYENLPYATDPDRMYRQPNHVGERLRILNKAKEVLYGND